MLCFQQCRHLKDGISSLIRPYPLLFPRLFEAVSNAPIATGTTVIFIVLVYLPKSRYLSIYPFSLTSTSWSAQTINSTLAFLITKVILSKILPLIFVLLSRYVIPVARLHRLTLNSTHKGILVWKKLFFIKPKR